MRLTSEQQEMLQGGQGRAVQQSMQILAALGEIYGAERLIPVTRAQISGVSFDNLGDAGLQYLEELAQDGRVRVRTTINPAGMDLERWQELGIPEAFARKQERVVAAFQKMGAEPTCSCTPYYLGNAPQKGEHIAWGESSAVTFCNSVLGARTNKEGGPSSLASALTGLTPLYGLHLDQERIPRVVVRLRCELAGAADLGALGLHLGQRLEHKVPYIRGWSGGRTWDLLKSLCASIVTYGGAPLFHIEGVTPEDGAVKIPRDAHTIEVSQEDLDRAAAELNDDAQSVEFVFLGCPHLSLDELARVAGLLAGKKVRAEVWVGLARGLLAEAEQRGIAQTIRASGAQIACDTCHAVAPLKGRYSTVATNSAKGVFYGRGKNNFKMLFGTTEQCIAWAVGEASPSPLRQPKTQPAGGEEPARPLVRTKISGDASGDIAKGDIGDVLEGRVIFAGQAEGRALVSSQGLSFFGGVDPDTGEITEDGHPLEGEYVAGRVLVFPRAKGSTVGSYTLYRLKQNHVAPAAIINQRCETVVAVGAVISEIPCVDRVDLARIGQGQRIRVDGCLAVLL